MCSHDDLQREIIKFLTRNVIQVVGLIRRIGTSYEGNGEPGVVLRYESVIKGVVIRNQAFRVIIHKYRGYYGVEKTGF